MKMLLTLVALVILAVPSAQSLTIVCDFKGDGPSNTVGSGDWTNLCTLAARVYETAFPGNDATVLINFRCTDDGEVGIASHDLVLFGGVPCRETEGTVTFRRDLGVPWFMDPNPLDTHAYTEVSTNLGAGPIKASRSRYLDTQGTTAWDFFNEALHEVGHALNMCFRSPSFIAHSTEGTIAITNGPRTGTVVPLDRNGDGYVISHILDVVPGITMSGKFQWNVRVMPSELDLVTLGFLSQFGEINTELRPVLRIGRPTNIAGRPMPQLAELSWIQPMPAPAGTRYRVQMCTDIIAGNWETIEDETILTNGVYRQIVPANGSKAFFRLSSEPIGN